MASKSRPGSRTPTVPPYFAKVHTDKGFFLRPHVVQEFLLGQLHFSAYRVWDWMERTLGRQRNFHPEQGDDPVLSQFSVADIQAQVNKNAPAANCLSRRTVERALTELKRLGYLDIEYRFITASTGQRQQVASAYRLRCPPALQVIIASLKPAPESAPTSLTGGPAKSGSHPPARMADSRTKTSKEKTTGHRPKAHSRPTTPPMSPQPASPSATAESVLQDPGGTPGYFVVPGQADAWVPAESPRLAAIAGELIRQWCIVRKREFGQAIRWLAEAEERLAKGLEAVIDGEIITPSGTRPCPG
ncbi:MAG: hypothetical protein ACYCUK_01800 [Thiomonas sp.]